MNENIRRIAEQTNLTIAESSIWRLKVEEFAQAIVKECADQCRDDDNAYDILKHFGLVE